MCLTKVMTGLRAQRRQELDRQILAAGQQQLAQVGAAALSVRAIARELGLASSAVYRYVASRDELLTRLVVAAYDDLGDYVEATIAAIDDDSGARLRAALRAVRGWAVSHPAEFALLYGSPVPGYRAPAEQTTGPGTRVVAALLRLIADLGPRPMPAPPIPESLSAELQAISDEFAAGLDATATLAAITLWTWLIGSVGQEVFNGFGDATFADPAAAFEAQLDRQLASTFEFPDP